MASAVISQSIGGREILRSDNNDPAQRVENVNEGIGWSLVSVCETSCSTIEGSISRDKL
jgi:hypothetical protein